MSRRMPQEYWEPDMFVDDDRDYHDEYGERMPGLARGCSDRSCGATDCSVCYPSSYDQPDATEELL